MTPVAVRVASYNVRTSTGMDGRNHWLLRRRAFVASLRGLDADLVGLQEARPGQVRDLRHDFAADTLVGNGRDADGGGEHAAVLVRAGGWEIESHETRWLSPTPDVPGSTGWGAVHPRVATLVRLRRGGALLGLVNTHLDHSRPAAREHGADLIVRWTREEADRPWVVVGDLNAPAEDPPVRILLDAGFTDALASVSGGTEHGWTGARDRVRIDHVLAGPGVEAVRGRIDHSRPHGRLPSDHWPVVADLLVSGVS